MSEIEGQLDLLALLSTREEEHPTPPRLTTSTARGYCAREAVYVEWCQRYGSVDCARVSHGWHATLCEAAGASARCQATVLNADLGCNCHQRDCQCVGDLYYRGACLHCTWEGPARDEQTQSVCDGLDHAHPEWRTSPTVAPLTHDPNPAQKRRWREKVDELYGDRPDGHPIITERSAPGTRAVPDRSPWGALRRGRLHARATAREHRLRHHQRATNGRPPAFHKHITRNTCTRIACHACYYDHRSRRRTNSDDLSVGT